MTIYSERLILRSWTDADRRPFEKMSADPGVMEYLMPLSPMDAAGAWIDRQVGHLAAHGMCFWAVERREDGAFVGAVGLLPVTYDTHYTPAVQIGWRIARPFWGLGYAPEAAAAAAHYGFETLGLSEIVANTAVANSKSQTVTAKIGMTRNGTDDFDHPRIPDGHALQRQMLYRLTRERWQAFTAGELPAFGAESRIPS